MKRILFSATSLTLLAFFMTGCSSSTEPAKKAAEKKKVAAEPVSGQSAIFQTFQVARPWAADAMLLKMENGDIPEAKGQPGKYGLWRLTYVSQSKKMKRDYSYAVADSDGGVIKGARAGSESTYIRNPQLFPFAVQDIKVDTTAALETALKEVEKDAPMKKVLDANKDMPVLFLLEQTGTMAKPQWRVIFGPSVSQSKFSIMIDASTGKFVKKLH